MASPPSIPRYEDMGLWTAPSGHSYPYLVMESVEGSTSFPAPRQPTAEPP